MAKCTLIDTDKTDDINPMFCRDYETFTEGYTACLSMSEFFAVKLNQQCGCDVNQNSNNELLTARIKCGGNNIIGFPGDRYTYQYLIPQETATTNQIIEILGINIMFALGILCGIVTSLIFSRG